MKHWRVKEILYPQSSSNDHLSYYIKTDSYHLDFDWNHLNLCIHRLTQYLGIHRERPRLLLVGFLSYPKNEWCFLMRFFISWCNINSKVHISSHQIQEDVINLLHEENWVLLVQVDYSSNPNHVQESRFHKIVSLRLRCSDLR